MTAAATPGILRRFVTLGDRQLHYRRAGSGGAILLLHRIPRSSADLTEIMLMLADKGTLIAPDLAGYGASDSTGKASPSLDDYAADLIALLDTLSIDRAIVYGEQIGAQIAARLAVGHPDRVAALYLRAPPEPGSIDADALPTIAARWDGSHLATAWSFLREEGVFAPFNQRRLANRILTPLPDPHQLQSRLLQLLTAGDGGEGYQQAFHAAAHDAVIADLARISTPTRKAVVLPLGERFFDAHHFDSETACRADLAAFVQSHAIQAANPADIPTAPIAGRLASRMVDLPDGQLHLRFNDDAGTIPLLVQHDAASSTQTIAPITEKLVGSRSVLAFDLPGSGRSDNLIGDGAACVADYADWLAKALDMLGLDAIDFYGMWGGGFVGLELALRYPGRVRKLAMSNLFFHEGEELRRFQTNYTPDVSPLWHGGHLLQCWHQMRDQALFFPWFDQSVEGIIRREPFIATAMVHERVCSLLRAGNMYRTAYQAHFVYPTRERVAQCRVPTLLATTAWDPNLPHTEAVASTAPHCQFALLDPDFAKWGIDLIPFLESQ
jgi:pimeloyl-ACP methyl ester carboxylesterase